MTREDWEEKWERMYQQGREDELGPKGRQYIMQEYGQVFQADQPDYDEYNELNDYEFDIEY